jgi:hypothetical protein
MLPDIPLTDAAGRTVSLSGLGDGETLVIFRRHLACLPYREHLLEVLAAKEPLHVRVACVTFSEPGVRAAFRTELGLSPRTLLLADPARVRVSRVRSSGGR